MTYPVYLTEHFQWRDVIVSDTAARLGIDNSLPPELIRAAELTAMKMEKVRTILGFPIFINSWYRGPALQALPQFFNPHSQHPKAEAVDFVCPGFGPPEHICKALLEYKDLLRWDQLIFEHTWVHASWSSDPNVKPRGDVLSLLESKGYAIGITDKKGVPL